MPTSDLAFTGSTGADAPGGSASTHKARRDDFTHALPTKPRVVSPPAVTSASNGPRGWSGARTSERSAEAAPRAAAPDRVTAPLPAESPQATTASTLAVHARSAPAFRDVIGARTRT